MTTPLLLSFIPVNEDASDLLTFINKPLPFWHIPQSLRALPDYGLSSNIRRLGNANVPSNFLVEINREKPWLARAMLR